MFNPFDKERIQREESIRDTFNDWVREGKADGMERRHRRLAERMFERIPLRDNERVLDIGCGDGWVARMLSPQLPQGAIVGIDVSDEMIARARELSADLENVLYAPAPAEEIPWAEDYFTHVVSIESAYYWPSPEMAAKEILRVTAYGGWFHILINFYQENPYSHQWPQNVGLSMQLKSADEWASLFRNWGFTEVRTGQIPDDSPIPETKQGAEREQREGLQRQGALYITGQKPGEPPRREPPPKPTFPILN